MAVFLWYLYLSSVHVNKSLHWSSYFFQGTRKTRSCLTGHPVGRWGVERRSLPLLSEQGNWRRAGCRSSCTAASGPPPPAPHRPSVLQSKKNIRRIYLYYNLDNHHPSSKYSCFSNRLSTVYTFTWQFLLVFNTERGGGAVHLFPFRKVCRPKFWFLIFCQAYKNSSLKILTFEDTTSSELANDAQ